MRVVIFPDSIKVKADGDLARPLSVRLDESDEFRAGSGYVDAHLTIHDAEALAKELTNAVAKARAIRAAVEGGAAADDLRSAPLKPQDGLQGALERLAFPSAVETTAGASERLSGAGVEVARCGACSAVYDAEGALALARVPGHAESQDAGIPGHLLLLRNCACGSTLGIGVAVLSSTEWSYVSDAADAALGIEPASEPLRVAYECRDGVATAHRLEADGYTPVCGVVPSYGDRWHVEHELEREKPCAKCESAQ